MTMRVDVRNHGKMMFLYIDVPKIMVVLSNIASKIDFPLR